jgi:ankyrin repeat protein
LKYLPLFALALALAAPSRAAPDCAPVEDRWLQIAIDVREGRLDRLDCLLEAAILNTHDPKDFMESRALHLAARYNRPGVVQYLINRGADLEVRDATDRTALQLSVSGNKSEDAATVLIQAGANIEAEDGEARTPLYWAVVHQNVTLTRRLLERRANRQKQVGTMVGGEYGQATIEEVARRSQSRAIRQLFETQRQ